MSSGLTLVYIVWFAEQLQMLSCVLIYTWLPLIYLCAHIVYIELINIQHKNARAAKIVSVSLKQMRIKRRLVFDAECNDLSSPFYGHTKANVNGLVYERLRPELFMLFLTDNILRAIHGRLSKRYHRV